MNKTYLEKLEYNKILEQLSSYCITYIGKNYVSELIPSNNKKTVEKLLNETNEALTILYKASTPPISEIADITSYLKILSSDGVLNLKSILDLTNILKISGELKKYFGQDFIDINSFKILQNHISNLYTNESIISKIHHVVIDETTISDDASSNLKDIRRKKRNIEQKIKNTLNNILHTRF